MGPYTSFCNTVANDAFLAAIMLADPIRKEGHERYLTALRRQSLFGPASQELLAHIAIQCFLNEYAWWAEPDEMERVSELSSRDDPDSLLRVACYKPLTDDHPGPTPLRAVVRIQVLNGRTERRLADSAPALTSISPGLSEAVQAMYEENPYPRWNTNSRPFQKAGPKDILIAGCGTGRHAIRLAMVYPEAQVLAVDLSRASLGYGMRKAQELGLTKIEWGQADLLRLRDLGRTFDHIECIGTLVCLDDPAEGLAVLVDMMRPDATLVLGLYSEIARRPLFPAMDLGKSVTPTSEGIRSMRREIMTAPADSPLRMATNFSDFYTTSGFRDMLLHVKEHRHTLPQVKALLSQAGLRFAGFNFPEGQLAQIRAQIGDDLDLDRWVEFEERNPSTFQRMYQFHAVKA